MIRKVMEDLSKKYPKGASLREIEDFCDEYAFLPRGSKLRKEIIAQIGHRGE